LAMGSGSEVLKYDVALSFAGEQRALAHQLATILREHGFRVFYDQFEPGTLWGEDLPALLDEIYREQSQFCVIFFSREYLEKAWPTHERRSAIARLVEEKGGAYILPIKVHDVKLPGVLRTVGYLSLSSHSIDRIGQILIAKIGETGLVQRATRLVSTAATDQTSLRALIALYRSQPADYELFESTLELWSDALIEALDGEASSDFGLIIRSFDEHLPSHFPFSYLNTQARLLGRIFRISRDESVRRSALVALLRIGKRFDEIDMGKEFANLAARALSPNAMRPIAEALKECSDCIAWVNEYLGRVGVTSRVFESLVGLGLFFADLGNPESEEPFDLHGWGNAETGSTVMRSPSGDRTLRYQAVKTDNSITFANVPNGDYRLLAEVRSEECDDSFQIVVNGVVLYTYCHVPTRLPSVTLHEVEIPRTLVQDQRLLVVFRNNAADDCGEAPVYNVLLKRH
jgi:hypothetical protein